MRKSPLVSVGVVVFLGGTAFGFFLIPALVTGPMPSGQEHVLVFTQEGACSPPVWGAPWAVVLNSQTTKAAPAYAHLPLAQDTLQANGSDENASLIAFAVPNGTYTYSLQPSDFYFQTGTVTVVGGDVVVTVQGPAIGCTTTTAT